MPRAYDQIVSILSRLNAVRANISALAKALETVGLIARRFQTLLTDVPD